MPEGSGRQRILTVKQQSNQQVVASCCAGSRAAGVRVGMTLAHARALLPSPSVRVAPANPDRDAAALAALAEWATRFTPAVAADEPDGLLLDITGCDRLFRGEKRLMRKLVQGLERLGIAGRLAAASTFGCAWAMARFGPDPSACVPTGEERQALGPLPVSSLRLDDATCQALHAVGIDRVESLFVLSRQSLAARFGPPILLRLDQALGQAMEMIQPVRPRRPLVLERLFDGPVSQWEAIHMATRQLIDELCGQLQQRESGVLRLQVTLDRSDLPPLGHLLSLSRPSRDARHLWSLLVSWLEQANMGFGIERIELSAPRTGRILHQQQDPWNEREVAADEHLGQLLDLLANRLGGERVQRMELRETHIPERVSRAVPAATASAPARRKRTPARRTGGPGDRGVPGVPGDRGVPGVPGDRPSVLLDPPEPVEVLALTPDGPPGPPCRFCLRGRHHMVIRSFGPERIGNEWWQARWPGHVAEQTRDYFRIQDDGGRWLWIFHAMEGGKWFVHGWWG